MILLPPGHAANAVCAGFVQLTISQLSHLFTLETVFMHSQRSRFNPLALALFAGSVFAAHSADAAVINWSNASGGSATTLANWNPQVMPTSTDTANFDIVGGYIVNWGAGSPSAIAGLSVGLSNLGLSLTTPLTVTGACNVQTNTSVAGAALTITNGAFTVGDLTVGVAPTTAVDGQCSVNGTNASMRVNNSFVLGGNNEGRMWVRSGATLTSHCPVRVGVGQRGILEVTGVTGSPIDRSTLQLIGAANTLRVGDGAQGDVNILDGALAAMPGDVLAGPVPNVQGAIVVEGALNGQEATMSIPGSLFIANNNAAGGGGVGTVRVRTGGSVTVAGQTTIGDASPSNGMLEVSGGTFLTHGLSTIGTTGTMVHSSGTIIIDTGALSINSGGGIFFIAGSGSGGAVLTLRNNAQWVLPRPGASANQVFMTSVGAGSTFNLQTGADFSHTGSEFRIGISNQRGTLNISDGSTFTTNASFGLNGAGSSLSVSGGSSVTCGVVGFGGSTGDTVSCTLSGAGTTFNTAALMRVGHSAGGTGGACQVSITDGAALTSTRIEPSAASIQFRQIGGAGGSLTMNNGTMNAADEIEYSNTVTPLSMISSVINAPSLSLNGATLSGNGTINANVVNTGQILPTGAGFTLTRQLSDNGAGILGSKLTFAHGSSYTGDGVLNCDIDADAGSTFTPSGFITMGRLTSPTGVEFDGVMNITNASIECFDSDGARIGGTVHLNNGELTGLTGLRFQGGTLPRLTGTGQVNDDCFMNGRIEPGIVSTDPTGAIDFITLSFGVAGSLHIDIEGDQPGDFDTISTVDDLDLNSASLLVNRVGNYYPPRGTVYRIAQGGSLFGTTFGTVSAPGFRVVYGVGSVDLVFDGLCDSIDFNNDESFFDPQDIDAFLSVFSEGSCIPETNTCNDIDFNNDGSVFDPIDIDAFLSMFGEGPCI